MKRHDGAWFAYRLSPAEGFHAMMSGSWMGFSDLRWRPGAANRR
jgi:hypothetical protein